MLHMLNWKEGCCKIWSEEEHMENVIIPLTTQVHMLHWHFLCRVKIQEKSQLPCGNC